MVAAGDGVSLLPKKILGNKLTVNEFDIPELEPTSINIWIHRNSLLSDYLILKKYRKINFLSIKNKADR